MLLSQSYRGGAVVRQQSGRRAEKLWINPHGVGTHSQRFKLRPDFAGWGYRIGEATDHPMSLAALAMRSS